MIDKPKQRPEPSEAQKKKLAMIDAIKQQIDAKYFGRSNKKAAP